MPIHVAFGRLTLLVEFALPVAVSDESRRRAGCDLAKVCENRVACIDRGPMFVAPRDQQLEEWMPGDDRCWP